MIILNPSYQSIISNQCIVCRRIVQNLGWGNTCLECSRKPLDLPSSANPVIPPKLQKNLQSEQNTGVGKGKGGVKDDQLKLMWHLLPWTALNGLVKVLTFGATKYAPNGWQTVPNAKERYTAALLRHLHALSVGERLDPESGLRHIDHLLCNAAFLSELED